MYEKLNDKVINIKYNKYLLLIDVKNYNNVIDIIYKKTYINNQHNYEKDNYSPEKISNIIANDICKIDYIIK